MPVAEGFDEGVKAIKLDLTSDETREQAASLAREHGFESVYESNKNSSGFVLLVRAGTNDELGRITAEMDADAMLAAVNQAVDASSN